MHVSWNICHTPLTHTISGASANTLHPPMHVSRNICHTPLIHTISGASANTNHSPVHLPWCGAGLRIVHEAVKYAHFPVWLNHAGGGEVVLKHLASVFLWNATSTIRYPEKKRKKAAVSYEVINSKTSCSQSQQQNEPQSLMKLSTAKRATVTYEVNRKTSSSHL